jgi:hypothetical protein
VEEVIAVAPVADEARTEVESEADTLEPIPSLRSEFFAGVGLVVVVGD